MSILTQSPEESIRQVGEELRAAARLSGSFMKPAKLRFGAWGVLLSFGTATEMEKLKALEAREREERKLPKLESQRTAPTWHLSVRLLVPIEVLPSEAWEQLGMLVKAAGVPEGKIMTPIEIFRQQRSSMQWQWTE